MEDKDSEQQDLDQEKEMLEQLRVDMFNSMIGGMSDYMVSGGGKSLS